MVFVKECDFEDFGWDHGDCLCADQATCANTNQNCRCLKGVDGESATDAFCNGAAKVWKNILILSTRVYIINYRIMINAMLFVIWNNSLGIMETVVVTTARRSASTRAIRLVRAKVRL